MHDFLMFLMNFQAGTQEMHGIRNEHFPDSAEGTQCVNPEMARPGDKSGMLKATEDLHDVQSVGIAYIRKNVLISQGFSPSERDD